MKDRLLNILSDFSSISLKEMDELSLMNRIDTKYMTTVAHALSVLETVGSDYKVLEINGLRLFQYDNIYYDTKKHQMLTEHLRGKLNRYKVRIREYKESNISFLEVKHKTNKGRTLKSRVRRLTDQPLNETELAFVGEKTNVNPEEIRPALDVTFNRFTLASHKHGERITFDFNLTFSNAGISKTADNLVIIEVKRSSGLFHTNFATTLKSNRIYPTSMSKYCLGMILMDKSVRYNQYKPKLLKLNKLSTDGIIW